VFACADWGDQINESNEHNNCSPNVGFEAIPRRWNVPTFTAGPDSLGVAPLWSSKTVGVAFAFAGIISHDHQRFFLWLASGRVSGHVWGSDGSCTYTGHGAVSHSPWDVVSDIGYLEITPALDSYSAEIGDQDYYFTETTTCPDYPELNGTSQEQIWSLQTLDSDGNPDRPMMPNSRTLAGTYNIPILTHGASVGQWSFKADVP
jgi:hypothetical protein